MDNGGLFVTTILITMLLRLYVECSQRTRKNIFLVKLLNTFIETDSSTILFITLYLSQLAETGVV